MKFQPKSEDQILKEQLPPEGWTEAEVESCEEKVSKSGNPMLKLRLRLFTTDGERVMFDYLLESFAIKLIHFCRAAGLEDIYKSGELDERQCVGVVVEAEIKHKTQKGGDYDGQVQANVADYRAIQRTRAKPPASKPPAAKLDKADKIEESDIPF